MMRRYTTIRLEGELLASPPQRVYEQLEAEATKPATDCSTDRALETALLHRGEPLIDFALARYAREADTLGRLFERATGRDREALRIAMLGNQVARGRWFGMPRLLYGTDLDEAALLAQLSIAEVSALFENSRIDDAFLTEFLECKEPWQSLDEERRIAAVHALSRNARMWAEYDGPTDGSSESLFDTVFDRAWALAGVVPTTPPWAAVLARLYTNLKPYSFSIKDPLDLARRWALDPPSENSDRHYTLTGWALVRQALGRLALNDPRANRDLLTHEDPGVRAAAYAFGRLTAEQMTDAAARDPGFAFQEMLSNERLWRRPDTRAVLHSLAWESEEPRDPIQTDWYQSMEQRMEASHPEWFLEEPAEPRADYVAATPSVSLPDRVTSPWPTRLLWLFIGALVAALVLR